MCFNKEIYLIIGRFSNTGKVHNSETSTHVSSTRFTSKEIQSMLRKLAPYNAHNAKAEFSVKIDFSTSKNLLYFSLECSLHFIYFNFCTNS